jgi:glycosyltransferase involved in cell wall biosynthesis
MPPLISVIIPTRNRAALLQVSLQSLAHQTLQPDQYEVIVVNDGSTDATPEVCDSLSGCMQLKSLRIEPSGTSAAKNLGIFAASAPILLIFDDDDYAAPNLLEEHLSAHRRYPDLRTAILGHTAWSPSLEINEVMHYVMDVGRLLFSYDMPDQKVLDFRYFWAGRISCKRAFIAQHGIFCQRLRHPGLEDIELGFRLSKQGLKIIYNRRCQQYMNRSLTFDDFCARCEHQGYAQYHISALHPNEPDIQRYCEVADATSRWNQSREQLGADFLRVRTLEAELALVPTVQRTSELTAELHTLYRRVFDGFKLKGLIEAQGEETQSPAPRTRFTRPLVEPIVVYQMGKVGSKAIEAALHHAKPGCPIIHTHMLNKLDRIEADVRKSRPNPVGTLTQIQRGKQLREALLGSVYIRCRLISLVRDPIARNISAFFQSINEFISGAAERYDAGEFTADDIIARFIESYNHDIPITWFQDQMKPVFGIDVFATDFPHQQGFAIYRGHHANLLVIKFEMLNECVNAAVHKFLGLSDFGLTEVNAGKDKVYKHLYSEVLDRIALPEEFIDRMYASRYARHFYTDRELQQFKSRWMRGKVSCIAAASM